MISRIYRFHGHNALKHLYKYGKAVRSGSMTLRYEPNPRRQRPRIAVIVSRKVHKSAVVRNRIRRRVYEAVRPCVTPESPALDMAFIIYDERVATDSPEELQRAVHKLLKKAGFTSEGPDGIVKDKE